MYVEIIGYIGSLLVVVSMLMTSVVRLRVINMIGSAIFTGYALAIHSYPTAALNFSLVCINGYNLAALFKGKKDYAVMPIADGAFLSYLWDLYADDIAVFFPQAQRDGDYTRAYAVFCGVTTAGIFLGTADGDAITVAVDYSTPAYRDCSVGNCLYAYLARQHVRELRLENASERHRPYLKKMGFVQDGQRFVKAL